MRPDAEPGMVWGVPAGLIACRADGEALRVAGISPRALWLRAPEPVSGAASLQLSLFDPRAGTRAALDIQNTQAGAVWRGDGAVLTRFSFEDRACAAAILRALDAYARYVELRGEWGAAAYARALTAYPAEAEEDFPASPEAQRGEWFSALSPLPDPGARELALCLDDPQLWQLYLDRPLADFMDAYATLRNVPRELLPGRAPDRLYVGNPHCRLLFPEPESLRRVADKAAREGLRLSIVTAELRHGGEAQADALLRFALERGAECVVNDWGMLERARPLRGRLALALGTRLNRRRKDPRMRWKAGFEAHAGLFRENALNDPAWRAYLQSCGITRWECERCGYDFEPPGGACSLHLPFYQTSTALWCPLRALCTRGDRGAQSGAEHCPRWCAENQLLYPSHLHLTGRWNALLALDARPWDVPFLNRFDRWVLNF